MTETPGNPYGSGESTPGQGSTPPPPPPPGAMPPSYEQPGAVPPGSQPPPAYQPPTYEQPGAMPPSYEQPGAVPPGSQPPPAYQPPPAAPSYQPPPAYQGQPSEQGGFAAGASNIGQQFQNFDPKTLQNFDPKTVDPLDWGIIAAGVLSLLFSFFSFYTVKVSVSGSLAGFGVGSAKAHENAWHGFFGWFGVLVVLIATVILAAELIAKISFPFQTRLIVLGGFALGLICELIALVYVPVDTGGADGLGIKVDKGHGFGFWLVLIFVLVGTVLAFRRFTATGGKLPTRG